MKLLLILILSILSNFILGQIAIIKEINAYSDISKLIHGKDTFDLMYGNAINYPIIETGNQQLNEKINREIRRSFNFQNENRSTPNLKIIKEFIKEGLLNLHYKVNYNKNGLLSISTQYEYQGAYNWTAFHNFNFNLNSGKNYQFTDLIIPDSVNSLKHLVLLKKDSIISVYRAMLKDSLAAGAFPDKDTYNKTVKFSEQCVKDLKLNRYEIASSEIIIYEDCNYPFYFSCYEPSIIINLELKFLHRYFKKEFFEKLGKY